MSNMNSFHLKDRSPYTSTATISLNSTSPDFNDPMEETFRKHRGKTRKLWFYMLTDISFFNHKGVLRCSMVECSTRNPGVLVSIRPGSSGFFVGVSLGKTLQSPSLVLVKPRKDMNNVSCRRDMTEIFLKAE